MYRNKDSSISRMYRIIATVSGNLDLSGNLIYKTRWKKTGNSFASGKLCFNMTSYQLHTTKKNISQVLLKSHQPGAEQTLVEFIPIT